MNAAGQTVPHFVLYPTLARDNEELHMTIASDNNGPVRISIYDFTGKLVRSLQLNKNDTYFNPSFSVGHLPAGAYLVKVLIGNSEQHTAKFIRL